MHQQTPQEQPEPTITKKTIPTDIPKEARAEKPPLPQSVAAIKGLVTEELAFQIVDALELAARRHAGNLHVGCIVFDTPYGEFRHLTPAPPTPAKQKDVNEDAD